MNLFTPDKRKEVVTLSLHPWLAFLRDIVAVIFGKFGQYIVTAITVPLSARLLGPSGTGELAAATSAFFFGSVLIDHGIPQLMGREVHDPERAGPSRSAYLVTRSSILAALAVSVFILLVTHAPGIGVTLSIGGLVGGLSSLGEEWVLYAFGRFTAVMFTQVVARISYLFALAIVLPLVREWWVPLICLAITNAIGTLASWWLARNYAFTRPDARAYRTILSLGTRAAPARLLTTSYQQGASAIYALALPTHALGIFSGSDKLVRAAQSVIDSVGMALFPRFLGRSPSAVRRSTLSAGVAVLIVGVCAASALSLVAEPLIHILYGQAYAEAAQVLRIEAWLIPATGLSSMLITSTLSALQDVKGILIGSSVGVIITLAGLTLTFVTQDVRSAAFGSLASEWGVCAWIVIRTLYITNSVPRVPRTD